MKKFIHISFLRSIVSRPVRVIVVLAVVLLAVGTARLVAWHRTPAPVKVSIADILRTDPSSLSYIPVGTYVTITGKTVTKSVVKYVFSGDRVASYFAVEDPQRGPPFHLPVLVMENFKQGAPEGQFTYTGQLLDLNPEIASKYRKKAIAFRRQVHINTIHVTNPYSFIPWFLIGIAGIAAAVKWRKLLTSAGATTAGYLFGEKEPS